MGKRRKPRASEIRVDFGKEQSLSGMEVSEDGTLKFFDENGKVVAPVKIETGSLYFRPTKKDKVLSRAATEPQEIRLNPNHSLSRFAFVIAVDTNTSQIGNVKVSMSVSVLVTNIRIGRSRWDAKLVSQDVFEFHDATAPPERVGWCEMIKRIQSFLGNGSVALIVDSELDDLGAFNARRASILTDFFLPERIELIYGCGDRGTQEFIANAAISDCDRNIDPIA